MKKIGTIILYFIIGVTVIAVMKETTEEVQLYSISTDKEYEGSFVLIHRNI